MPRSDNTDYLKTLSFQKLKQMSNAEIQSTNRTRKLNDTSIWSVNFVKFSEYAVRRITLSTKDSRCSRFT